MTRLCLVQMSSSPTACLQSRYWSSAWNHVTGSAVSSEDMPQWWCLLQRTQGLRGLWCQDLTYRSPTGPRGSGCHRSSSLCPETREDASSQSGIREEEGTGATLSPRQPHCTRGDPEMLTSPSLPCRVQPVSSAGRLRTDPWPGSAEENSSNSGQPTFSISLC